MQPRDLDAHADAQLSVAIAERFVPHNRRHAPPIDRECQNLDVCLVDASLVLDDVARRAAAMLKETVVRIIEERLSFGTLWLRTR